MKIIAPVLEQDPGSGRARTDSVYALQWRKALEDAQWQARQRIAPCESGETDLVADERAVSAESTLPSRRMPNVMGTPVARLELAAGESRIEALAAAIAGVARAAPTPPHAAIESMLAIPPVANQETSVTLARIAKAEPPPALSWYELPEWPNVMVHASARGTAISVGMRDRSLQEKDALDLFYRLRAQLRAVGFELVSLTVNGRNVTPADDAALQLA